MEVVPTYLPLSCECSKWDEIVKNVGNMCIVEVRTYLSASTSHCQIGKIVKTKKR